MSSITKAHQRLLEDHERKRRLNAIQASKDDGDIKQQVVKSIIPAGTTSFTLLDAKNKIEQANLINSGLADATTMVNGQEIQLFKY